MPDKPKPEIPPRVGDAKEFLADTVQGLSGERAYLLIFALDVVFFLFGSGSSVYGIAKGKDLPLYLGLAALFLGLLAAVYVIKLVLGSRTPEPVRQAEPKKLFVSQFTYLKVIHFTRQDPAREPIYHRQIERLHDKAIPVYDEAICFTLMVYSSEQSRHKWDFRSSGVVDPQNVFPWIRNLTFADADMANNEQYVFQNLEYPANTSLSVCHSFNGLQPGHEDCALKAICDVDDARLIVDFSSIPGADVFIREVHASFIQNKAVTPIDGDDLERHPPALFSCAREAMREGQVIKIALEIDWTKVPSSSGGTSSL